MLVSRSTGIRLVLAAAITAATGMAVAAPSTQPATKTAQPAADSRAAIVQDILQWRQQRVEHLRKPDGWLSLVGLHWIEPGVHQVGKAASNDVQLRTGPAKLGTLALKDGQATFKADPAAGVTIDGKPVAGDVALRSDATTDDRGPSIVAFNKGTANFQVIERSGKFALRVKDAKAPTRTGFVGIDYFDADPSWRFVAKFEPHPKGQTIPIATVINTVEPMVNSGTVSFQKDGKTYKLEVVDEGDGALFLIFGDRTNGRTTYGAGRFLYAEPVKDGMTVVDFNKAYNPPCVFTHYATCPLPPPENRLDLTITAGEKKYRGAASHEAEDAPKGKKA